MTFTATLYYLPFLDNTLLIKPPSDFELANSSSCVTLTTSNCEISNRTLSLTFTLGTNQYYIYYLQDKFNCIRLYATDDNTTNPLGDYKIIGAYQSAGGSRVRFTCELSQYQVYRLKYNDTSVNNANICNFFNNATPCFLEYGYKYNSILGADGYINWNKNATTDIYRPIAQSIEKNVFQGRDKILWDVFNLNGDDSISRRGYAETLEHGCKYWINIYVQSGAKIGDDTIGYSNLFNYQKFKNNITTTFPYIYNMSPALPYEIISFGIADNPFLTLRANTDANGDNYAYFSIVYQESIMNRIFSTIGTENILQITATPIPPFIDVVASIEEIATGTFAYNQYRSNYLTPIKIPAAPEGGTDIYLFRCNKLNGSLYNSLPYTYTDFAETTGDSSYNDFANVYTSSDLSTIKNPYIALNSKEIILTSSNGSRHTINLLNLGLIKKLTLSLIYTFELGASNYLCGINLAESDLPYYVQNNGVNLINTSIIGVGATGSNANSFVYSIDQLAEYLLNNKNFYLTRDANIALQREQNTSTTAIGAASSVLSFAATTIASLATGNPIPLIAGTIGAVSGVVGTGVKSVITSDAIQTSLDNSNRYLDNLASAPDKLIISSSPFTDIINNECGLYLNFYCATEEVQKTMLNDFLTKGIYLNKYVDKIQDYINLTEKEFDKKYCKYIKGSVDLCILPDDYQNVYADVSTSKKALDLLINMIANGINIRNTKVYRYINTVSDYNYELNGAQVDSYIQITEPVTEFN